jgi:hypothetical protein
MGENALAVKVLSLGEDLGEVGCFVLPSPLERVG